MEFLTNTIIERLNTVKNDENFDIDVAMKIVAEVAETKEEAIMLAVGTTKSFMEHYQ